MKKKVSLIFPTLSEKYGAGWSVENVSHPLPSGLAILASNLEDKLEDVEVRCFGNQIVSGGCLEEYLIEPRSVDEFVDLCSDSDIVGMSILYNNVGKVDELSRKLKKRNPSQIIVLGGPEVSNRRSANLILKHNEGVDFIISGDGEEPLVSVVKGESPEDIANLFYKKEGEVVKSKGKFVSDLNDRQVWDYSTSPFCEDVIRAFDSRTLLYQQLREKEGNLIGRIGVQLSKGCEKAEKMGRCRYCVSGQDAKVTMRDANKFWEQVLYLNKQHGVNEFFVVDNILATPKKLDALTRAKENYCIPEDIQFRAYGYVEFFREYEGHKIMGNLKDVNVRNLFLGVENFYPGINKLSNKPEFNFGEVEAIVKQAKEVKMDMFLPLMIGLPGDSKDALAYNFDCTEELLKKFANRKYGLGGIVRMDLSVAMPIIGTPWYNQLISIQEVSDFYHQEMGESLVEEFDPDYDVLRDASLRYCHPRDLVEQDLNEFQEKFKRMCYKYLNPEQIGGYDLKI